MNRTEWDYIRGCLSLTRQERLVVLVGVAVIALGAAVQHWRESHAVAAPVTQMSAVTNSVRK